MHRLPGQTQVEGDQDWQASKLTIAERGKHLLTTGIHTDCEFLVGADGSDQQVIKAHKLYLAQSSPVFESMFFGMMAEGAAKAEPIVIPDLAPSSFNHLLQYIYTDKLELQSLDQVLGLYYTAKKYMLPDLAAKCVQCMITNLCSEYTCRVLGLAMLFEEDTLKETCLSFLREKTVESLAPPEFEDLPESTVLSIVNDEALNITELELFDAAVRWAGHQCAQRDLEINGTNMRKMLCEILKGVRFLAMKPEEFASTPALSEILTEEERFAIFMNLSKLDSFPMPPHLSSCRNLRGSSYFSRREHGGRSTIVDGIYVLRDFKHVTLALRKPSNHLARSVIYENFWAIWPTLEEPYAKGCTTIMVDKEIILKSIVFAGMVLADQQLPKGLDMLLDCHLYDSMDRRTPLATVKVSQKLPRHVTPITLESDFNSCVRLQPNRLYEISVCVPLHAHFLSDSGSGKMASTIACHGVQFSFSSSVEDSFVRGLVFNLC